MYKSHLLRWFIISGMFLYGCSIDASSSVPIDNSAQPISTPSSNRTEIPANLNSLNLSGKLIYTSGKVDASPGKVSLDMSVQSLDLVTGVTTTIYAAPADAWIDSAIVSPDGMTLLMTYQPPKDTGRPGFYSMPLDSSQAPQALLIAPSDQDQFYQPQWSPDGKYVYFTHVHYQGTTTYEVMRMSYPDGGVETLVEQAYWPNASGNGLHITYVSVDPQTGTNDLFIANTNGAQAQQIPLSGSANNIIDAPIFYPDDQSILFSAPVSQQFSSLSWIDKMLGITTVYAHGSVPSEWWSIPLTGDKPTQLTRVGLYELFARFSPDQRYIASFSTDGIFIMKSDGTDLTNVVKDVGGVLGTVDWIQ